MRLLFLSNEFPNLCKPTKAPFNYDLLTALADDHEVTVVSPISWFDELRTRVAQPSRPWPRLRRVGDLVIHHPRYLYTPGTLRHHYGSFMWWSLKDTVSQILRGPRPDCVISYWAHPDGETAVRLANMLGVPSVVMVGGSDVLLLTQNQRRRRCIQRVLEQADAVVAVSRDLADRVVSMGVAPHRVHAMRRGVDKSLFFPGDRATARRELGLRADGRLLMWVGRMVPVKGLDVLLAACQRMRDEGRDFQLCLVGDGPLRPSLAAEVERRGLSDRVTFAGVVNHDQLGPWFRAADVTVLPSRSEGVPNVLLESLACGTPFVASAVGGVPEIASPTAGRLVTPNAPDALAAALGAALTDPPVVDECDRPYSRQQFATRLTDLIGKLKCSAPRPSARREQSPTIAIQHAS